MFTSYFSSPVLKSYKQKLQCWGISLSVPTWWKDIDRCPELYPPSWEDVILLKNGKITFETYKIRYTKNVLNKINTELFREKYIKNNSVFICWEKNYNQCHRKIVAEWIRSVYNVCVTELVDEKQLLLFTWGD